MISSCGIMFNWRVGKTVTVEQLNHPAAVQSNATRKFRFVASVIRVNASVQTLAAIFRELAGYRQFEKPVHELRRNLGFAVR